MNVVGILTSMVWPGWAEEPKCGTWYRVDRQPPEIGQRVLILDRDKVQVDTLVAKVKDRIVWEDGNGRPYPDVTWWMPLPSLPK